jgi:alpha-tubulin suppressor-like RCC1 family protein
MMSLFLLICFVMGTYLFGVIVNLDQLELMIQLLEALQSTTFAGGTNWKQISTSWQHIAAIKTDGTLWTWGNGTNGRLGNNVTTNRSTPVTTFAGGTDWKQVSCG